MSASINRSSLLCNMIKMRSQITYIWVRYRNSYVEDGTVRYFHVFAKIYIWFESSYLKALPSKYCKLLYWWTFPRMNNSLFLRNFWKHFLLTFFNKYFFLIPLVRLGKYQKIIGIKVIHNDMLLSRHVRHCLVTANLASFCKNSLGVNL